PDAIPDIWRERIGPSARNDPPRVDALSSQQLNDPLSKLPQADPITRQACVNLGDAENIAPGRLGIHSQQKVRHGKVEEAQSVGLDHLRKVHDASEFDRRFRNTHREDSVAGLGGGEQMAYRADAADPRHEIGHLEERTPLAEFLKSSKLSDVEVRRFHASVVVQLDRDFSVPFQPRHRINENSLGHLWFSYAQ